LTTTEAAELLGVTRQAVARWCESGAIDAHRTAGGATRRGEWRIAPKAVEAFRREATKR
jgi:excisionase family DNA binding protein